MQRHNSKCQIRSHGPAHALAWALAPKDDRPGWLHAFTWTGSPSIMSTEGIMTVQTAYQWLEPRPRSNYRQLFIKGRKLRAEVLYRAAVNSEPRTPDEVARDYHLPVEAVREAIQYCLSHADLLQQERERGWAKLRARQPGPGPSPAQAGAMSSLGRSPSWLPQ